VFFTGAAFTIHGDTYVASQPSPARLRRERGRTELLNSRQRCIWLLTAVSLAIRGERA
jgi:hypothetical protein